MNTNKYENHKAEPFAACENPAVPRGRWLLKSIPEQPKNILDVGCGVGIHAKWFSEQGIKVKGITINPTEVQKRVHPDVGYGDMLHIPFKDETFDCVFCLGTLEHTHSPFIALCEFNRVLKENGYLFVDMPGIGCMMINNPIYFYHKSVMFPVQMRDLFLRTNFKLIDGNWVEKINGNKYEGDSCAYYLTQKIKDVEL